MNFFMLQLILTPCLANKLSNVIVTFECRQRERKTAMTFYTHFQCCSPGDTAISGERKIRPSSFTSLALSSWIDCAHPNVQLSFKRSVEKKLRQQNLPSLYYQILFITTAFYEISRYFALYHLSRNSLRIVLKSEKFSFQICVCQRKYCKSFMKKFRCLP